MDNPTYKLETFEGPLDLLIKLIEKNKVQITDIPIAIIFAQYMEYIGEMKRMDMEIAGEFIVMASELMLIKSKMLLPTQENEEDPRKKLAEALAEYSRMKAAAEYLAGRFEDYAGRLSKDTDEVYPDGGRLEPQSAEALRRAMLGVMRALDRNRVEKINKEFAEQPFERILRTPIVPVAGKIFGVIRYLVKHGETLYTSILLTAETKSELIATFLAVLELIKKNRVSLRPIGEFSFDEGPHDYAVTLNRSRKEVPISGSQ